MAIIKYKIHPSIKAITDRMEKTGKQIFNFKFTSHEETDKEVNNLKIKKSFTNIRYSSKTYQENVDFISYIITLMTCYHVLPFQLLLNILT